MRVEYVWLFILAVLALGVGVVHGYVNFGVVGAAIFGASFAIGAVLGYVGPSIVWKILGN